MTERTPDRHHACKALLDDALSSHNIVLTATFHEELLAVMRLSDDPGASMRLGLAIYRNAVESGDTSACVEILLDAVHGTRRCVARVVRQGTALAG